MIYTKNKLSFKKYKRPIIFIGFSLLAIVTFSLSLFVFFNINIFSLFGLNKKQSNQLNSEVINNNSNQLEKENLLKNSNFNLTSSSSFLSSYKKSPPQDWQIYSENYQDSQIKNNIKFKTITEDGSDSLLIKTTKKDLGITQPVSIDLTQHELPLKFSFEIKVLKGQVRYGVSNKDGAETASGLIEQEDGWQTIQTEIHYDWQHPTENKINLDSLNIRSYSDKASWQLRNIKLNDYYSEYDFDNKKTNDSEENKDLNVLGETDDNQINVLTFVLNPVENGQDLVSLMGFSGGNVEEITNEIVNQTLNGFQTSIYPDKQVQEIRRVNLAEFPPFRNGAQYSLDEYKNTYENYIAYGDKPDKHVDYIAFNNQANICQIANEVDADEIIIINPPLILPHETLMFGPNRGYYINGPFKRIPECNKNYRISEPSLERASSAMHNYGHSIEWSLMWLSGGWSRYDYQRFIENFAQLKTYDFFHGGAGELPEGGIEKYCGNTHFPFNSTQAYDYANEDNNLSICKDWELENYENYENIENKNCHEWGCNDSDWQNYWISKIPSWIKWLLESPNRIIEYGEAGSPIPNKLCNETETYSCDTNNFFPAEYQITYLDGKVDLIRNSALEYNKAQIILEKINPQPEEERYFYSPEYDIEENEFLSFDYSISANSYHNYKIHLKLTNQSGDSFTSLYSDQETILENNRIHNFNLRFDLREHFQVSGQVNLLRDRNFDYNKAQIVLEKIDTNPLEKKRYFSPQYNLADSESFTFNYSVNAPVGKYKIYVNFTDGQNYLPKYYHSQEINLNNNIDNFYLEFNLKKALLYGKAFLYRDGVDLSYDKAQIVLEKIDPNISEEKYYYSQIYDLDERVYTDFDYSISVPAGNYFIHAQLTDGQNWIDTTPVKTSINLGNAETENLNLHLKMKTVQVSGTVNLKRNHDFDYNKVKIGFVPSSEGLIISEIKGEESSISYRPEHAQYFSPEYIIEENENLNFDYSAFLPDDNQKYSVFITFSNGQEEFSNYTFAYSPDPNFINIDGSNIDNFNLDFDVRKAKLQGNATILRDDNFEYDKVQLYLKYSLGGLFNETFYSPIYNLEEEEISSFDYSIFAEKDTYAIMCFKFTNSNGDSFIKEMDNPVQYFNLNIDEPLNKDLELDLRRMTEVKGTLHVLRDQINFDYDYDQVRFDFYKKIEGKSNKHYGTQFHNVPHTDEFSIDYSISLPIGRYSSYVSFYNGSSWKVLSQDSFYLDGTSNIKKLDFDLNFQLNHFKGLVTVYRNADFDYKYAQLHLEKLDIGPEERTFFSSSDEFLSRISPASFNYEIHAPGGRYKATLSLKKESWSNDWITAAHYPDEIILENTGVTRKDLEFSIMKAQLLGNLRIRRNINLDYNQFSIVMEKLDSGEGEDLHYESEFYNIEDISDITIEDYSIFAPNGRYKLFLNFTNGSNWLYFHYPEEIILENNEAKNLYLDFDLRNSELNGSLRIIRDDNFDYNKTHITLERVNPQEGDRIHYASPEYTLEENSDISTTYSISDIASGRYKIYIDFYNGQEWLPKTYYPEEIEIEENQIKNFPLEFNLTTQLGRKSIRPYVCDCSHLFADPLSSVASKIDTQAVNLNDSLSFTCQGDGDNSHHANFALFKDSQITKKEDKLILDKDKKASWQFDINKDFIPGKYQVKCQICDEREEFCSDWGMVNK